jgi:hypothetical protein
MLSANSNHAPISTPAGFSENPHPSYICAYRPTDAMAQVAASCFGDDVWILDGHLRTRNTIMSQRRIDFNIDIPRSLQLSKEVRDQLILVEKEMLKWEHDTYGNCWESTRSTTRRPYKRLVKLMADWGIYRVSHLTHDHARVFLLAAQNRGRHSHSSSAQLLKRLFDLRQIGIIPDGLAFDPSTLDVGFGSPWVNSKDALVGKTKPIDDALLLPALAASILFVRRYTPLIVTALQDVENGRTLDLTPFGDLAFVPSVKSGGLGAIMSHAQNASYIIIASTVVGRLNEFLDLRRGCHHVKTVSGECGNYIALPWSKLQGSRPVEDALAMNLTGEAVRSLENIIAAHPDARHSEFLFARLWRQRRLEPGPPISDGTMRYGLPRFLQEIVHFSPEVARSIHSHQFRTTALLRLCGVQDGLVVAFRESRHASIAETCKYLTSDVARLGIPANMARLTGEAA